MNHLTFRTAHRCSATLLLFFIVVHLGNHISGIAGADTHILVMRWLRSFYRIPMVEIVLLAGCMTQIVTGFYLVLQKWAEKRLVTRLQLISGLYLGFFIVYHVSAVMLGRYVWNVETDFHFAAWGVKNFPAMLFFIPYYGTSIIALFVHLACVHFTKMSTRKVDDPAYVGRVTRQAILIALPGFIIAVTVVVALSIN